ncbi:MAG: hypothetical protein ACR2NP_07285 [Pirellulaceae bacterium]
MHTKSPGFLWLVPTIIFSVMLAGCDRNQPADVAKHQPNRQVGQAAVQEPGNQPATAPVQRPPATGPTARLPSREPAAQESAAQQDFEHELRILHWNIESGGSHPTLIASQLRQFADDGYHLIALSEVHEFRVYDDKFDSIDRDGRWQSVLGASGINSGREDDRLMIFFDSSRLKLISSQELNRYDDFILNDGRHRSPLVAHFEDRESNQDFLLLHNHLARGNAEFRQEQAAGLREFARDSSLPLIAVGDYNFDYVFDTRQGNPAFNQFIRDSVWRWIEPEELIDTNWYDPESDGIDNYPGSMLDFTFVAGPAREWSVISRVVVREGDFPDDDQTSDHRPVEVVVRY